MFYGLLHTVLGHSGPKPFRPGTHCFLLCLDLSLLFLGYIVWFGNSFADYITKALGWARMPSKIVWKSRCEFSYIILTIFLLSSRSQMCVEIDVCKLINDKVWY